MIFGKTRESADALSLQFREREVAKGYEATVQGRVNHDSGTLIHYLKKNSKTNYVTVFPRPTDGAKRAELSYRVLERMEKTTRLSIELKTGRSHQIRAQLAKMGHPIVGDVKYSKRLVAEVSTIQLKAVVLAIDHPKSGTRLEWKLTEGQSS
jgi:23S rRNA pseudouridine1911/1915/1917 synthase